MQQRRLVRWELRASLYARRASSSSRTGAAGAARRQHVLREKKPTIRAAAAADGEKGNINVEQGGVVVVVVWQCRTIAVYFREKEESSWVPLKGQREGGWFAHHQELP